MESLSAKVILVTDQHPLSGTGVYATQLVELLQPSIPEIEVRNLHYFRYPVSPPHQPITGQHYAASRVGAVGARRHNERTFAHAYSNSGDLVHLLGASYDLAARLDRPIATVHDFGLRTLGSFASARPQLLLVEGYSMVDWLRLPRFLARCRALVSVSDYTRTRLRDWTGLDSTVIPHWVEDRRFRVRPSGECRDRLRLPRDRRVVLCVGSGAAYKNHALLRRVAAALPPEYLFVKVGYPLRGDPAQVRNEGLVLADDYPLYFGAADAYVHLSHREGFGMPLVESLASGTPIVALANPPAPEVLGDAALLLDPATGPEKVVGAIRSVVEAPDRAAHFRQAGLERIRIYDPARVRAQYVELYLNAQRA